MRERLLRPGVTIEKLLITATLRIHKESMTDETGRSRQAILYAMLRSVYSTLIAIL